MKTKSLLLLLSSVFLLTTVSCKKKKDEDDEKQLKPTQEQKGFAINYTGTWCGACGSWGAPLIHQYAEDAPNGAVICVHLSSYTSDPMENSALSQSFEIDRTTGGYVPSFWIGDVNDNSNSAMTSLLNQPVPECGVDYSYEIKNGKMTVKTKVKFFDDGQGEYYLSVLVLEDGIPGGSSAPSNYQQNGTNDPNFTHDFVLRASADQNRAYGHVIATDPSSGDVIDGDYTIDLDGSWNDVYAVCIVWRKDISNGRPYYKYVNALKRKN